MNTAQKSYYIHQVTTMLATSKNILFPGHNHLLTSSADPTFDNCPSNILEVAIIVVTWWIVAFFAQWKLF